MKGSEVFLSGADDVPEEYRKLVEQYYKSLSKGPEKAVRRAEERRPEAMIARRFPLTWSPYHRRGRPSPARRTSCVAAARRCASRRAESFDGGFTFCRGMFTQVRRKPSGAGWTTDYPDADINFSIRLSELTKTHVGRRPDGEPNHLTVRLTDDNLFNCPDLHMEDIGAAELSEDEVARLREYLLKGGFLWVDDYWGTRGVGLLGRTISRVLPPKEYPDPRSAAGSSALSHAVSDQGCAADSVDPDVEARRQHIRSIGPTPPRCMDAVSAITSAA